MDNKKGQIWLLVTAIAFIIMFVVGIASIIINRNDARMEKCKSYCLSYEAQFVDYEPSGYTNEECWCRKGNEPLRIW